MNVKRSFKSYLLLVMVIGLLNGCSKEESSVNSLNPPSWLHGKWGDAESNAKSFWVISKDNLVFRDSFNEISYKDKTAESVIEPKNTDSEYRFVLKSKMINGSQEEVDFIFKKDSDKRIVVTQPPFPTKVATYYK